MAENKTGRHRVASGVSALDRLLGGLFIGDNVVWYDDAGSLASVFCLNLIQSSQSEKKPVIYVSFDRSPRNLLERLGPLAENPLLTIIDCFTWGKGAGSDVFLRFYYEARPEWPCRIIRVDEPRQVNQVMDALYGILADFSVDVRLVFESITGMQELWGGEDHIINFYSHSCPRLYELNTVAYWIMEKNAHSSRLRAQINQIAQVSVKLAIKRGITSLTILKADRRGIDNLLRPYNYWTREMAITFEDEKKTSGPLDLGLKLKEIRTKRGLSQTELAKLVGVTPSTISQVESSLIYPSLPALAKMAEVLNVAVSSFFHSVGEKIKKVVFSSQEAVKVKLPDTSEEMVLLKLLTPVDFNGMAEPCLLEFAPETKLNFHFFMHKGDEIGYLLSGKLHMSIDKKVHKLRTGDTVYLTTDMPNQWYNPGPGLAKLLWIKIHK